MEGGIHFRLLSRIVQRLHMPSVLYWGLGTSVYLHSSSSPPTDLWSQSPYYISVPCMPVKMLYSCLLVDADLAIDVWSSDYFKCTCPRTCHEVLPKHVSPNGKEGIIPLRYVADKHTIRYSLHVQTLHVGLWFMPSVSNFTLSGAPYHYRNLYSTVVLCVTCVLTCWNYLYITHFI